MKSILKDPTTFFVNEEYRYDLEAETNHFAPWSDVSSGWGSSFCRAPPWFPNARSTTTLGGISAAKRWPSHSSSCLELVIWCVCWEEDRRTPIVEESWMCFRKSERREIEHFSEKNKQWKRKERLRKTLGCEKGPWWWEMARLAGKNGGRGSSREGGHRRRWWGYGRSLETSMLETSMHAYHIFFSYMQKVLYVLHWEVQKPIFPLI